jgi:peptidoglycan/xylan/chitin deacetylase (PgdA/CDA1 family)
MREHRATYCDAGRFALQMGWLARMGYGVISLDDALEGLGGRRELPPRAVVLTFDDGYRNFAEHAAPVLLRHGFPATVFLLSGMIGGRADWLLADGHEDVPLLDRETILSLQERGFAFGSHGVTHRRLSSLGDDEVLREVAGSRRDLEALLGRPVRHFCYPYGDYDGRAVAAAREAGYASAVTCRKERGTAASLPLELPRLAVSFGMNLLGFVHKIHLG